DNKYRLGQDVADVGELIATALPNSATRPANGGRGCRLIFRRTLIGSKLMRYPASISAVALAIALLASPAAAQVIDFGKYPDFKGRWDRVGPPNNWRQLGGEPPLKPEYKKMWEASIAEQKSGQPGNWPSTFCIPEGMPAMMNVYNPMEIIIT